MAKLSAHGNELVRMEQERDVPVGERVIWERRTVVLMADGVILCKRDVRFRASTQDWDRGGFLSYGWKKQGRARKLAADAAEKFRAAWAAKGYKEVVQWAR